MLESVEWGEYRLGDLFETKISRSIDEGKVMLSQNYQPGLIEFVGRTTVENGVKGYTRELGFKPNSPDVISVSQIGTITAQIRTNHWYASQNIFLLSPKKEHKKLLSLFGISAINKALEGSFDSGYSNYPTLLTLQNLKVKLPILQGEIDYDFMERFIAELNAYLTITGLKDYTLTPEEEQAIKDFKAGNVKWGEFDVIKVFDVRNAGNILANEIVEGSGSTPYLCASRENNAVSSYISYREEWITEGNCIFIGGKTFVVTYQECDFFSNDSHNLTLRLYDSEHRTKLKQLYLATCVNKSLGHKYSWGDSVSNRKIQKDKILLPCIHGQVNFSKMDTFISAIQKLVIKDVVLYSEKEFAAARRAIQ
ncbi:MAG: restriction endonuclease subunit S [Bacteroidales bacterium]|nr:restriction endonuclease subunit S [Bacteroidales bacterium]